MEFGFFSKFKAAPRVAVFDFLVKYDVDGFTGRILKSWFWDLVGIILEKLKKSIQNSVIHSEDSVKRCRNRVFGPPQHDMRT